MNERLKDTDSRAAYQQLIKSGEFKPFFQPIVSLEDQHVVVLNCWHGVFCPKGLSYLRLSSFRLWNIMGYSMS